MDGLEKAINTANREAAAGRPVWIDPIDTRLHAEGHENLSRFHSWGAKLEKGALDGPNATELGVLNRMFAGARSMLGRRDHNTHWYETPLAETHSHRESEYWRLVTAVSHGGDFSERAWRASAVIWVNIDEEWNEVRIEGQAGELYVTAHEDSPNSGEHTLFIGDTIAMWISQAWKDRAFRQMIRHEFNHHDHGPRSGPAPSHEEFLAGISRVRQPQVPTYGPPPHDPHDGYVPEEEVRGLSGRTIQPNEVADRGDGAPVVFYPLLGEVMEHLGISAARAHRRVHEVLSRPEGHAKGRFKSDLPMAIQFSGQTGRRTWLRMDPTCLEWLRGTLLEGK